MSVATKNQPKKKINKDRILPHPSSFKKSKDTKDTNPN